MPHKKQRVFKGYAIQSPEGYYIYGRYRVKSLPQAEIPKGYYRVNINHNQMTTLIALLGYKDAYASLVNLCA